MTTLGDKLREALDKNALIKTTLNAWDAHEDQIRKPQQEKQMANPNPVTTNAGGYKGFVASNNVMRETFNAVKNAPNMTHSEYVEMLNLNGFKRTSTSAVLYQLLRAGQVKRDDKGQLTVTCDEYVPIKQPKKKPSVIVVDKAPEQKPRQIVIVKKPKDAGQGIAALKGDSAVVKAEGAPFEFAKPKAFHPSAIVDNLSVLHARELYDYLKKIFGGN
jgi:hypothetical protein